MSQEPGQKWLNDTTLTLTADVTTFYIIALLKHENSIIRVLPV